MHTYFHLSMLISDWLIYGLLALAIIVFFYMRRHPHLREPWAQVLQKRLGMVALVVLLFYVAVGLLDSIHIQVVHKDGSKNYKSTKAVSVLDMMLSPLGDNNEKTYSAPFAIHLFNQSLITLPDGKEVRGYPRLQYGGAQLTSPNHRGQDITWRISKGIVFGLFTFLVLAVILIKLLALKHQQGFKAYLIRLIQGKTIVAWREALLTFAVIWTLIWVAEYLDTAYHILGTNKVGQDIFYEAIKSIRTGLLIGTLTTIFILPFALILGTIAGFFRGWIDDIIQYIYTTLSSIPGVLLISATILVLQVYIANHTNLFPTLMQRADARLLALCFILGITSWASLCRLLRGETLKLRELEYIQAAKSLGVSNIRIVFRHIVPNVFHIVLITLVLDFSGLVLAEAVLSYVGVGVDPTMMSWGNMINSSRLELAREPLVWWPLLAALIFMFGLVLSANLFADSVRDAFDPHLRNLPKE